MTVYEGANIQGLYFADAQGIMSAGTMVDVTFKYRLITNSEDTAVCPLFADVPVFFFQVTPDMADFYAPPNPDRTFYESQHYPELLPDDPLAVRQFTYRVTVPTLSSAGNPAILLWFGTNAMTPDLLSFWCANTIIFAIDLVRYTPPKLSIRGHSSGARFD